MNRDELQRTFRDPPLIHTNRLVLRKMLKTDYKDMFEYACREDVTQYLLWDPHETETYTYKYLQYIQTRYRMGEFYDWAVVLKGENKMIGTCGFTRFTLESNSAEIGYVLNPNYWGNGLATEAVRAVLRFAFMELRINRIEAKYMEGNQRSRRVMEKVGMQYEGTQRESMHVKGHYISVGICSILRREYLEKYL